jgi:Na+/melibiose symporter-like transporter
MVSYAAMIPAHNALMKRNWAKPLLFRMGIPLYMAGVIVLSLYPANFNDYLILPICILIGIGLSGCQLMPWFIFPDVVDLGELKFGERNTGSFSGLMTFTRKTTVAVAIGLSGFILDLSGFVKPTTDLVTGLVTSYEQPYSAIIGLRAVIAVPVVIFLLFAFIAAKKLKLNPQRSLLIGKMLGDRDYAEKMTEEEKTEFESIKKELF